MSQLGKSLSKDELPWRPGDGKKRVFSSKWLTLLITAPSGNVKFQSCLKENHLFFICLLICWRNLFKTGLPQSKLDDKCVLQSAHQSSSNKIRIIHAKIFIMFQNILIYILNHTLDNMKYLSFGQVWTRKQMHSLNMEQFGKLKEKKNPKELSGWSISAAVNLLEKIWPWLQLFCFLRLPSGSCQSHLDCRRKSASAK